MRFWNLFGGNSAMENDLVEIQSLREKVKSLQQTIDMQLEVMEKLQDDNAKLVKENERLKRRIK